MEVVHVRKPDIVYNLIKASLSVLREAAHLIIEQTTLLYSLLYISCITLYYSCLIELNSIWNNDWIYKPYEKI